MKHTDLSQEEFTLVIKVMNEILNDVLNTLHKKTVKSAIEVAQQNHMKSLDRNMVK